MVDYSKYPKFRPIKAQKGLMVRQATPQNKTYKASCSHEDKEYSDKCVVNAWSSYIHWKQ